MPGLGARTENAAYWETPTGAADAGAACSAIICVNQASLEIKLSRGCLQVLAVPAGGRAATFAGQLQQREQSEHRDAMGAKCRRGRPFRPQAQPGNNE